MAIKKLNIKITAVFAVVFMTLIGLTGCSSSSDSDNYKGQVTLQQPEIPYGKTSQFLYVKANTDWILEMVFDNYEDQLDL